MVGLGGLLGGQQVAVFIRGIDDLTNPMGKATKALERFEKKSKKVEEQTNKTDGALNKLSKTSLITKIGLVSLAIAVASLAKKFIDAALKTEENRLALEKLSNTFQTRLQPTVSSFSSELNSYILLMDKLLQTTNQGNIETEKQSNIIGTVIAAVTAGRPELGAYVTELVNIATAEEQASLQAEILSQQQLTELANKFNEVTESVKRARDILSIKSEEELQIDRQIADLKIGINQSEADALEKRREGDVIGAAQSTRLVKDFEKRLEELNIEKENIKLRKDEDALELETLENIHKKIATNNETFNTQLSILKNITIELQKQASAVGSFKISTGGKISKSFGGKTISSKPPKPPEKDFLMRPGQPAVSFSPQDTIMGVKNPSKLGGPTINIFVQGNVVRMRDLAEEVSAELRTALKSAINVQ